ncbi:MAG: hypothetical protein M1818_005387 [Claussenomyces sp. TS43310]|nr:MAG: hypothetical protein M1818_005387 [Claussenomyces sp. TS43310]
MTRRKAAAAASVKAIQKRREKRKGRTDWTRKIAAPGNLVAKPVIPKSKHHSYFEFAENTDKKKKIEFLITDKKEPTAGFTFVPIGNPELTNACKELSREDGALMYIVSARKEAHAQLGEHVHRVGYHFRSGIVEKAAASLGSSGVDSTGTTVDVRLGSPDRIPDTQEEVNKQADAAIRDLFPRIPNTDREMIIQHAFQKGAVFNGKPVVGLQEDLSLSRRVQLAVIAHIRHTHTRYDLLLRETSWENARKAVESLCLDILVKWRGDEETGRDQLDEVLREIVVISDSEEDEDSEEDDSEEGRTEDEEDEEDTSSSDDGVIEAHSQRSEGLAPPASKLTQGHSRVTNRKPNSQSGNLDLAPTRQTGIASRTRSKTKPNGWQSRNARKDRKRFERYAQAVSRRQRDSPLQLAWRGGVQGPRLQTDHSDSFHSDVASFHCSVRGYKDEPRYLANEPQGNTRRQLMSPLRMGQPVNAQRAEQTERWQHRQSSQSWKPLLNSTCEEQVILRSRNDSPCDKRSAFLPELPQKHARTESFSVIDRLRNGICRSNDEANLSRVRPFHDMVIPSIEPTADLDDNVPSSNRPRRTTYERPESVKVRYPHDEHIFQYSQPLPDHSAVIYIDDTPPKARRMVTGDHHAGYIDTRGDYVQLGPQLRPKEHGIPASDPSFHRDDVGKPRVAIEDSYQHPGVEILPKRSRISVPERASRHDRELDQPLMGLSLDDGPRSGERQRKGEMQNHKRQRIEDQSYYETSRPSYPPQKPLPKNVTSLDTGQSGGRLLHNAAPQGFHSRLAPESFYSMSSSSNHHHSHGINSRPSATSEHSLRPVPISRAEDEYEADVRSMSARNGYNPQASHRHPVQRPSLGNINGKT